MIYDCPTPPPFQELLLLAATLPPQEGHSAWKRWNEDYNLEAMLRESSVKLLPAIGGAFREGGIDDPHLGILRGLSRRAWYLNGMLIAHGLEAAATLEAAGIRALFLKGAALIMRGVLPGGDRRLSDVDILVPNGAGREAVDLLLSRGWKLEHPITEDRLRFTHGAHLSKGGAMLDLHWFIMEEWQSIAADEKVWGRSEQVSWQGRLVRVPSLTDLFIHVCINGARTFSVQCIWALDAMRILSRRPDAIDWELLLATACERELGPRLSFLLRYLQRTCRADIPEHVLAALGKSPASLISRLEQLPPSHILFGFCGTIAAFLRRRSGSGRPLRSFLRFLRFRWSAVTWRELFTVLAARCIAIALRAAGQLSRACAGKPARCSSAPTAHN